MMIMMMMMSVGCSEMAQVDAVKNKMSKEITELKKDKVSFAGEVETCSSGVNNPKFDCR